jgi:hypothetical protein
MHVVLTLRYSPEIRVEATVIDLGAPFVAQGGTANFNCRTVTLSSMQIGAQGTVIADGQIVVLQTLAFDAGTLQGTNPVCHCPPTTGF